MVTDFCPSPFSRAWKQESEEGVIKVFIFASEKRSAIDEVGVCSLFIFWEDSYVVS